jgi:hypothetical protein
MKTNMGEQLMTEHLPTHPDDGVTSESRSDGPGRERPAWHRPLVTRIPLAQTLSVSGSNTDGHTGSLPA